MTITLWKGLRGLAATALALLLVFSLLGNSSAAPQGLPERRNWTPQAMLYLKGARTFQSFAPPPAIKKVPGVHEPWDGWRAAGRELDQVCYLQWSRSRSSGLSASATFSHFSCSQTKNRGSVYIFVSPERRSPNARLLTLPEAAALLLASLQKPQEAGEENLDPPRFLDNSLLNW
ncbi:PREDICTED: spexin [Miniopterus natalensis]|uniref:spexin n=1 Tax=Miniopterus natalensis TaxID=291302 RepID=UPI0007A6CEA6|nr:PREDICTED: spexin [Miniopterus natalensis]